VTSLHFRATTRLQLEKSGNDILALSEQRQRISSTKLSVHFLMTVVGLSA
jgi:hypothetical protein